jgi:hypothetical protein
VGIIKMVSADHPWQDVLVGVLEDLHARDAATVQIDQVNATSFSALEMLIEPRAR